MVFYVVRHGETDWNTISIVQGSTDIQLNAKGLEQAASAREAMKEIPIEVIYSSPLARARVTADVINEYHQVPIFIDPRLTERCFGIYEGKHYSEYPAELFWDYEQNLRFEGAETVKEVFKRVYACLDEIREKHPGRCVMLAVHGGMARAVYSYFGQMPAGAEKLTVICPNAVPVRFEIPDNAPIPTPLP